MESEQASKLTPGTLIQYRKQILASHLPWICKTAYQFYAGQKNEYIGFM